MVAWATAYGDDWERLWAECPRGDWLLGLAARAGVARQRLVLAAVAAARTAFDPASEIGELPRGALELAEAWAAGRASAEECRARALALEKATPPDPALAAIVQACQAALLAIEDPSAAAGAASGAAEAALFGAGDCALMPLLSFAQRETAAKVREHVPFELLAPLLDSSAGPAE